VSCPDDEPAPTAAQAVVEGSWALPTIDTKPNIRSYYAPLGPVWVFGRTTFPGVQQRRGGDFAAAIAAGNPVIAKANTSHRGRRASWRRRLSSRPGMPACRRPSSSCSTARLTRTASGWSRTRERVPRPTRAAGARAQAQGRRRRRGQAIYLELSSVNPVVILPGDRGARGQDRRGVHRELPPGHGPVLYEPGSRRPARRRRHGRFIGAVKQRFEAAAVTPLLSSGVARSLATSLRVLQEAGARVVTGGTPAAGPGYRFANTLLRVDGSRFVAEPGKLQTEAFGNATLMVVAKDVTEAVAVLESLEGNLTGSFYTDSKGADDALYETLAPRVRSRVGGCSTTRCPQGGRDARHEPRRSLPGHRPSRLHRRRDPASLRRFGMLQCFDGVRPSRLPPALRDKNLNGRMWRLVDGSWSQRDLEPDPTTAAGGRDQTSTSWAQPTRSSVISFQRARAEAVRLVGRGHGEGRGESGHGSPRSAWRFSVMIRRQTVSTATGSVPPTRPR